MPDDGHVSEAVELIWYGDDAPWYDHGPEHPLRPARVILTHRLIEEYRIPDEGPVTVTTARDATDDELLLVHTPAYLEAVRSAGAGEPAGGIASASAPATTRSSPTCTRPPRASPARR